MQDQRARAITHKRSDLLWRDEMGCAVSLEEARDRPSQSIKVRLKGVEKSVMAGFYVNLSQVGSRDSELRPLVDQLRRNVATTLPLGTGTPATHNCEHQVSR